MADVLHGTPGNNQLNATANRTQVYGLAGNDTLTGDGKSEVLLIGGSGNVRLSCVLLVPSKINHGKHLPLVSL